MYGYDYSYAYNYGYGLSSLPVGYWYGASLVSILLIICYWKLFEKANEPGWAAIVPFYNTYVLFKMAFGNGWMFLLLLVPIVNVVFAIMLPFKIAKAFGKGSGFGAGLLFIPVIFYPLLAFGSDKYIGTEKNNLMVIFLFVFLFLIINVMKNTSLIFQNHINFFMKFF